MTIRRDDVVVVCTEHNTFHYFNKYGQFNFNSTDLGECLLFPSFEGKSWEDYFIPHYNFKPFDKVAARYDSTKEWIADMFSHIHS